MGLIKELNTVAVRKNNTTNAIMDHIATGKKYLVQEMIPDKGASQIEDTINLFYENGYNLKSISNIGGDTSTFRSTITLIFEKM